MVRYDKYEIERNRAAADVRGARHRPLGDEDKDCAQSRVVSLLNGHSGVSSLDLPSTLGLTAPGDTVKLGIWRQGTAKKLARAWSTPT